MRNFRIGHNVASYSHHCRAQNDTKVATYGYVGTYMQNLKCIYVCSYIII